MIDLNSADPISERGLLKMGLPVCALVELERKPERWHDGISWAPAGLYVNTRQSETSKIISMLLRKRDFERIQDPEIPTFSGDTLKLQVFAEIQKHFRESPSDDIWILEVVYSDRTDYIISYIGNGRVTYRDLVQLQEHLLAGHIYAF